MMSTIEKTLDSSLPSIEIEYQALVITIPNDCEEPVSAQSSLSDFPQNTSLFTEVRNSIHGSEDSLNDEIIFRKPLVMPLELLQMFQKFRKKHLNPSLQSPQKVNTKF